MHVNRFLRIYYKIDTLKHKKKHKLMQLMEHKTQIRKAQKNQFFSIIYTFVFGHCLCSILLLLLYYLIEE